MAKILKYGDGDLNTTYLNNYVVNKCPSLGEIRSNLKSDFEITSVTPSDAISTQLITGISINRIISDFCTVNFSSSIYTLAMQWKLTIRDGSESSGYICYLPSLSEGDEWSDGITYSESIPADNPNGFPGAGLNVNDFYDYITVELASSPDTELVDRIDLDASNINVNGDRYGYFDNSYTATITSAELYSGGVININILSY